ncbi:MAG TPA: serpin family protein [Polyangiaceae bacterium]
MKANEQRWVVRTGLVISMVLGAGCNGTSTGNPMDPGGGSAGAPAGSRFLKSELARDTEPSASSLDRSKLAASNREFAFELYRTLAAESGNLFLSPFSISVAFGMTYPGAEGDTEREIADTLHFDLPEPVLHASFNATLQELSGRAAELAPQSTGSGFELSLVNQAWGQDGYPFLSSYLDVLAVNYGAGLFALDFAETEPSRQIINQWVSDQTAARIEDLIPEGLLDSETRLVLTNAIYFKANWLSQFDEDDTEDAVFHAPEGDRPVRMMNQQLVTPYAEGAGYRAVELPYLSPAVRMLLVLPGEDGTEFASFAANLDDARLQEILAALSEYEVTLGLPKFQFESEYKLKTPLQTLGMPGAFTRSADFSGIAGGIERLWIDEVFHKAFVAVDEKGTEAAAATAVVIRGESAKPQASIRFDRPFLFVIYDEPTGQLLFLGHLLDPE